MKGNLVESYSWKRDETFVAGKHCDDARRLSMVMKQRKVVGDNMVNRAILSKDARGVVVGNKGYEELTLKPYEDKERKCN